jgi:hypothetical protein
MNVKKLFSNDLFLSKTFSRQKIGLNDVLMLLMLLLLLLLSSMGKKLLFWWRFAVKSYFSTSLAAFID